MAPPRWVVVDLHMPDLGALALLRKLLAVAPGTPMIIITGDDSLRARREAIESDVHAIFEQTVDAVELLAAIASATGRPAS